MTSKASIAADLRALGVKLSASKLKKTTLAELKAMLHAKRAEAKRVSNVAPIPRRSKGVNLPAKPASRIARVLRRVEAGDSDRSPRQGRDPHRTRRRPRALDREQRKERALLDVAKVKGYGVRTEIADDGTQPYHLVLPKGVKAPFAHVKPAPVSRAANRG